MAAKPKIRCFFKIILSFNIERGKLRLPLKFVRSLKNEIPDTAKLHTPDNRVWNTKVVQDGSHVWLEDGFGEFARHYSIKPNHLIHFKHNSKSDFSVRIYNMSCCEMPYTSHADAPPIPTTIPDLPKFTSDSGFLSPRHFKSKYPFFDIKLTSFNFQRKLEYVPVPFIRRYMAETQAEDVKLIVSKGRQWNVGLWRNKLGRLTFGKGWNVFSKENKLKEGDVCIFELAKGISIPTQANSTQNPILFYNLELTQCLFLQP